MLCPVGALISRRLEDLSRTQSWLAKRLKVSNTYVSNIIHGQRDVSNKLLGEISNVLQISRADLLFAADVQKGDLRLDLSTTERRACALSLARVWMSCSTQELGEFQRLAESFRFAKMSKFPAFE